MKKNITFLMVLVAFLFLTSCTKEEKLKFPEGLFSFTPKTDTVPADGRSIYTIEVRVKDDYKETVKSATLKTDKGGFETETISFNQDGVSMINIHSSETGTANITLTYNDQTFATIALFITAAPESIYFTSETSATNAINTRFDLAVTLKRTVGNVSKNTQVQFSATDDAGNPKGQFFNTSLSDDTGNINSQYWLQDSLYHGFIHFKAIYVSGTDTVTGINQVYFTE